MNKKRISLMNFLALSFAFTLIGCTNTQHQVLSSTGTVIGIDISQDPATQAPHAKIGYDRSEIAIVPTNRSQCAKTENSGELRCTPQQGAGAKDTTDVLMELRFKSALAFQGDAGIYQRLAIGPNAVRQPGAALMFSKNDKGDINQDVAKYLAQAQVEITTEQQQLDKIIAYVTDGADAINMDRLTDLINKAAAAGHSNILTPSVTAKIKKAKTGSELKALLFDPLDRAISPIYKSLPSEKQ